MSRGPKNVTSTTETEPPAFLLGPLTTAANAAQSSFLGSQGQSSGLPGGFGGANGGISFENSSNFGRQVGSPFFTGNAGRLTNGPSGGPSAGNDLIGQSQGLTSRTLAGDFLNPDSNPFLQSTFNRAADLTRTRLSSEFAGAGRDLGAAQPARSDELQTLASNIFGGNFQRERDKQVGAIDQSQGLDPLNLLINRLAGIIPGAGGSTQSTQPVFRTGLF